MRLGEIKDMLIQVITTWQVIAASVVVILYFFLVSYVAKVYSHARSPGVAKKKKRKNAGSSAPAALELDDTNTAENEGAEEIITEE
jgi:ABC-type Na+ efflux pump permease subunit